MKMEYFGPKEESSGVAKFPTQPLPRGRRAVLPARHPGTSRAFIIPTGSLRYALVQYQEQEMNSDRYLSQNRHDAGRQLAQALGGYKGAQDTIILALPRGGAVVGLEISLALGLPMDVLVTRKLGNSGNSKLAMGALAETRYRHLNADIIQQFNVCEAELQEEVRRQHEEINRQIQQYRRGQPLPSLSTRTVILVDDGIATGATFYASLAALRAGSVRRLIAAVPVAPPRVLSELQPQVDEAVILEMPTLFFGIGQFYLTLHRSVMRKSSSALSSHEQSPAIRDWAEHPLRAPKPDRRYRCERWWR
jgi:putative phosphoribosyl transferase